MQIITISRGSLMGADLLADSLSNEFNLPVFRREDVFTEAEKYSIRDTGFCDISFVDRAPSVWERQYYRRKHYLLSFQVALLDLMADTGCIYEGHLGQHLFTNIPFVLKIRAIMPTEKRVSNWMKLHDVDHDQAFTMIKLMDDRRRQWSEFLYNLNLEDATLYDLVINIETMDIGTAVKIVKAALEQKEFNSTPETLVSLQNLHLAAKAKLYLYLSPVTRGTEVDLEADSSNGTIKVIGLSQTMDNDKSEMHIRNVLNNLQEIKQIEYSY